MKVVVILLICLLLAVAIIFVLNRTRRPTFGSVEPEGNTGELPTASSEISVLTWNIGYAGLGKKADFFADKGKSLRALSRAELNAAATSIISTLTARKWEVICMQENAAAGFLTRGVPVRAMIDGALSTMRRFYWADLKTILMPKALQFDHGMSTYANLADQGCEIVTLPQSDAYYVGFLKKYYVGQRTRFPIKGSDKEWIIINIHLSAFDAGGRVRTAQLCEALAYGQREFEKGNFVIFGGDWNMRISTTDFPHTTADEFLSWLVDFPLDALPEGWQIAADPDVPTMRSLQARYQAGHNFTSVVDGFVVSPNVKVEAVRAFDLGFADTDHHPVEARFSAVS